MELASFRSRLIAFALDMVLLNVGRFGGGALGALVAITLVQAGEVPPEGVQNAGKAGWILGWFFWGFAVWFLNYGVLQGMSGATVGKKICKIHVTQVDGAELGVVRSLLRSFCYLLSALPLYTGFAAILWSKKRQAWHDLLCKTVVLVTPRSEQRLLPLSSDSHSLDKAA